MESSIDEGAGREVTYAIADIHGRLDLLEELLGIVEADATARQAAAKIVFTGDYCDRGADTYGVVERLMAGPGRAGDRFVCLRGNHDDLLVRAAINGDGVPDWSWFLFNHTLQSYDAGKGGTASERLRRHVDYLAGLPLTHDDGRYLFVHAGIRPGVALADQLEEDLLWIRHEFLDYDGALPRRVVHGHTIIGDTPIFRPNRISNDTGAFRSGILTAIVLDGEETSFLQAIGKPDEGAVFREAVLARSVIADDFAPELDRRPGFERPGYRE